MRIINMRLNFFAFYRHSEHRHPGESRDPGLKHAVKNQAYDLDPGFRRDDVVQDEDIQNGSLSWFNHRNKIFILLAFFLLAGLGCERKNESNKILHGLPVDTTQIVLPAQAIQQFMLLKRDSLGILVPILNRLAIADAGFPEVSGPDSNSRYTFRLSENRYGTADFTIQFLDAAHSVIDPISFQTSTSTIKTAALTTTGSSSLFAYTEDLSLTLATTGDVNSEKRVTGNATFTGSGYTITFVFDPAGSVTKFGGILEGLVTATGTGPGSAPMTLSMRYSTDHSADGNLTWEGQSGGLHIMDDGSGSIVTSTARLFVE